MKKTKLKWSEMNKKQRIVFVIDWILRGVLIAMCAILIGAFVFSCFGTASEASAFADDGSSKQVSTAYNSASDIAYVNSGLDQYNLNLFNGFELDNLLINASSVSSSSVSKDGYFISFDTLVSSYAGFYVSSFFTLGSSYSIYFQVSSDVSCNLVNPSGGVISAINSGNNIIFYVYSPSSNSSLSFFFTGIGHFEISDVMIVNGTYTSDTMPDFQPSLYYVFNEGYTAGNSAGYEEGYNKGYDDGYSDANSSRQISLADSTNTEGYVLDTQTPPGGCTLSYSGNSITATGYPSQKTIPAIKWKLPQTLPSGALISVSVNFSVSSLSEVCIAYLSGSEVVDLVTLTNGSYTAFSNVNVAIDTLIVYVPSAYEFTISNLIVSFVGSDYDDLGQSFYDRGYNTGYNQGKSDGFQQGFDVSGNGGFGWLISSVQSFLDTKFFGDFGVGTLLYVGLGIALCSLFIKFFGGG